MRRVPCLQCRSLPADGSGLSNKPPAGPDEDQPQGSAQARGATAVPLLGTCWQHLLGHHGQAVGEELVTGSGLTHRRETTPSLTDHPCMATKDVPSRASGPLSRHKGQGVARGRWWAWVLSRTRSTHPLLLTGWETESRSPCGARIHLHKMRTAMMLGGGGRRETCLARCPVTLTDLLGLGF